MKNLSLLLVLSLFFSCSHFDRRPNEIPFTEVEKKIQSEIAEDQKIVTHPEHATKLYSHGKRTEKAILVMHGLHESPNYMKGFSEHFYKKGYNVLSLRLPSHMLKTEEALNHAKATQWIEAAEEAFSLTQQLGNQVEILGYSTGGTLGVYLSLKNPEQVKALYLIAPALALSNRVFAASTFTGWLKLDLLKYCDPITETKNAICKLISHADDQIRLLLQEKIMPSAAAGFQVQSTINFILQHYGPRDVYETQKRDYYADLREAYLQLKVPMVMINSEADHVVMQSFNYNLMNKYEGPHVNFRFKKDLNINHLMINKSKEDAFKNSDNTYNPRFEDILTQIDSLNK